MWGVVLLFVWLKRGKRALIVLVPAEQGVPAGKKIVKARCFLVIYVVPLSGIVADILISRANLLMTIGHLGDLP